MEQLEIKKILDDSDMILVGIGEDFADWGLEPESADSTNLAERYLQVANEAAQTNSQWAVPYIKRFFHQQNKTLIKAYEALGQLLKNRDYFIINTCTDGLLDLAKPDTKQIVEPCGSCRLTQCSGGCPEEISADAGKISKQVERICRQEIGFQDLQLPHCEKCGSLLEFNSLYAEHYVEQGYLEAWDAYQKWLQLTPNRRLCILELGAGMMFASLLRFPFEKIAGLNQKSTFIRVHKHLYQLPDTIVGKGISVIQSPVVWLQDIYDNQES